jgi:hypothetical protein
MHSLFILVGQTALDNQDMVAELTGESSWGFFIGTTIISCIIQAGFGWWAMVKADEMGSNKTAAFIMGFLFLYLGVRMVPILRKDRIFAKPIVPRPLPPRPTRAHEPQPFGPPGAQPYGPPSATPAAPDEQALKKCSACGSPYRPGRKLCMICGAAIPAG